MISGKTKNDQPLCKFGPGGDFTYDWQPKISQSPTPSNRLVKFFASVVEVAAILIGLKRINPYAHSRKSELTVYHKERVKNASDSSNANNPVNTPAAAATENGSLFSGNQMLFPDHSGNGIRIRHKPKHRIRTYHRTAKKRSALRPAQQSSLFESQLQSARTA
jgi:hypothetical protein